MTTSLIRTLSMDTVEGARRGLGLTVRDLCPLLGCSRQTYYTWLRRGLVADASRKRVRNRLTSLIHIVEEYELPDKSKERAAIMTKMMEA